MIWRNIFKTWAGVLAVIAVVASAVMFLPFFNEKFSDWKAAREAQRLTEAYTKDNVGGQSPEETYDLYIQAVRSGDIELASKYFIAYKQDDRLEDLKEYRDQGFLNAHADELERIRKIWKKSEKSAEDWVSFTYDITIEPNSTAFVEGKEVPIPAGTFQQESVFVKYPTNVWKIEVL